MSKSKPESTLRFKHPGNGMCPFIEVPEGRYLIQDRLLDGAEDEHKLLFVRSGGWLRDTGEADEQKAIKTANRIITGDDKTYLWWSCYGNGRTTQTDDDKRYYLFKENKWPWNWFLRCCYDEETVMVQGTDSYLKFVKDCEEYINEKHGQCSLW